MTTSENIVSGMNKEGSNVIEGNIQMISVFCTTI